MTTAVDWEVKKSKHISSYAYCSDYFSYILTPFGYWVGVKERKPVKVQQNPILEGFYEKNGITKSNVEVS